MAVPTVTAKNINALSGREYAQTGGASEALRRLIGRLEGRIAYWLRYRATVTELGYLTDRQLADIGVARGDIPAVARAAARHFGA